jgi:hypothetical protein
MAKTTGEAQEFPVPVPAEPVKTYQPAAERLSRVKLGGYVQNGAQRQSARVSRVRYAKDAPGCVLAFSIEASGNPMRPVHRWAFEGWDVPAWQAPC